MRNDLSYSELWHWIIICIEELATELGYSPSALDRWCS
jgi:hypothetical protein